MLENALGYKFKDRSLMKMAITHSSYANERNLGRYSCNERLEFLGDSLLGFFVSEYLYTNNKDTPEGVMTRMRAEYVCEQNLVRVAENLGLGTYLMLGKGEILGGGRKRKSILADAVEAVLAAIYLDGGREPAQNFVHNKIIAAFRSAEEKKDYKTILQEAVQSEGDKSPVYKLVGTEGPDHQKYFISEVWVKGKCGGRGKGRSKKASEQAAAQAAVQSLGYG